MRPPVRALLALAPALALGLSGPPSRAEVSAVPDGRGGVEATLEMFDRGSTPWRIWSPVRAGAAASPLLLNPDGDLYMDGPPSIVFNPTTRLPEAVWSYWDGSDYEIAWSRFDGSAWHLVQAPSGADHELLTQDENQDLDPRLWIDQAGNRRVVWWRSGGIADEVVVSVLPAGEVQWWAPQRLSSDGVPTRRPDIRTTPYGTFVAAEEQPGAPGALAVVVFESRSLDGDTPQRESDPWGRTNVRATGSANSLSVAMLGIPASSGELPAVSWREGTMLATSVYDPEALTWSEPYFVPWPVW